MKPWLAALVVGAVILLLWLGFTRRAGPVADPARDAHLDSAQTVHAAADSALVHADTAIVRASRDSIRQLADSAQALGHRLDALDRLAAQWQRTARRRADSLAGLTAQVDSMLGTAGVTITGHVELTPPDATLACESRYAVRLEQISLLARALDGCLARRDTLLAVLVGVRDTLARVRHYSAASDSLLRWERDRPRPCRVDVGVATIGCGAAMGGVAVVSVVLGVLVAH